MSRKAEVFLNGKLVGELGCTAAGYVFQYKDEHFRNPAAKSISLTLPKNQQGYQSPTLFAFFYNLLPEGVNKQVICRELKIDENDFFTLLLKTAHSDTIGAVTVREILDE